MKRRPQFNDLHEAARVSSFMEEAEQGRWRIKHFTVTDHEHRVMVARAIGEGGPHREERVQRTVLPGDYVCLSRKAVEAELDDILDGSIVDGGSPDGDNYVPIMSDTNSEIEEHVHAFECATGNVLITGLGLGVVVSALLAKPCATCEGGTIRPHLSRPGDGWSCPGCHGSGKAVSHITVVEIDRDVIALTGPYYEDEPRVTIVNADALAFARSRGTNTGWVHPDRHFDYAWHDIWSHISDRNLDDDSLAEHGISYRTMFRAYEPLASMQSAWAWPQAQDMRARRKREEDENLKWARAVIAAPDEQARVDLLVDFRIRQTLGLTFGHIVSPEIRKFFIEHMKYETGARQMLAANPDLVDALREIADADVRDDPHARPNEAPEANVA